LCAKNKSRKQETRKEMKVLVFEVTGFTGRVLVDYLSSAGCEVVVATSGKTKA
jgi:nucleoside-diphosphate-sugar epimerase